MLDDFQRRRRQHQRHLHRRHVDGSSSVLVTGAGSRLTATTGLSIGDEDCGCGPLVGTLTIADGGVVEAADTRILASSTLRLGTGGLGGTLITPAIRNDGPIVANFTDTRHPRRPHFRQRHAEQGRNGHADPHRQQLLCRRHHASPAAHQLQFGEQLRLGPHHDQRRRPAVGDRQQRRHLRPTRRVRGRRGDLRHQRQQRHARRIAFRDSDGLTKTGAGTMTLSGVNTLSGRDDHQRRRARGRRGRQSRRGGRRPRLRRRHAAVPVRVSPPTAR